MWVMAILLLIIILICFCDSSLRSRVDRDIAILYKRTDKKTKEFENERQIRVKLQKRLSKLEHEMRTLKSKHESVADNVLDMLKDKNEPAA